MDPVFLVIDVPIPSRLGGCRNHMHGRNLYHRDFQSKTDYCWPQKGTELNRKISAGTQRNLRNAEVVGFGYGRAAGE